MSMKLACPRCRHVQFFGDALAGEPVTCAKCDQPFRVPRQAEPVETALAPMVPLPLPGLATAREVPATFAPTEPLPVKVIPLPDAPQRRTSDDSWNDDSSGSGSRRGPRLEIDRTRPVSRAESGGAPWGWLASGVVCVLLLFAGTALWYLIHDHRPPLQKQVFFRPDVKGEPVQPGPMQQMPMPGPGPRVGPGWQQQQIPGQAWNTLRKGQVVNVAIQGNEQLIPIKLEKGTAKVRGTITLNDPSDPLSPGCHRKVYVVDLEAKRHYTIEMNADPPQVKGVQPRPGQFDPFLRVETEKGVILDWNDDIVQVADTDSRLKLQIQSKGRYRIIATTFGMNETGNYFLSIRDEDMGKPVTAKPLPPLPLPQPKDTQRDLAAAREVRRNLTINSLFTSEHPLVGDLCWSRDASAFFTLDEIGTLRRISLAQQREERRLELGFKANSLTLAKSGLLVSLPSIGEIWVVNTETLQVVNRISASGVERVTATPDLDLAFAAAKLPANPLPKDILLVLDVAAAKALKYYEYSPKFATVSPDGKHLFAEGGVNQLVRYTIEGTEVSLDEEGPRIGSQSQGICLSGDGKLVCLASRLGNLVNAVNPPAKDHTIFVYASDNLKEPAFTIETGPSPRALGFDPRARVAFAHNKDKQLMQFSETGKKLLEVNLPGAEGPVGEPRQFLTHPDGFRVLVRTEATVYDVQFLQDEKK